LDTELLQWGAYEFHKSHGFGGLDRGLYLYATGPVSIEDFWIANTPRLTEVQAHLELNNTTPDSIAGEVHLTLFKGNGETVKTTTSSFSLAAAHARQLSIPFFYPNAQLWSPDDPNLYRLQCQVSYKTGKKTVTETTERTFGFRWFCARDVGSDAVLCLNEKRIRVTSAISWGFWGLNGLFPTPELAEREVLAAKSFNMNCIQFHRNIGKTEVLDAHDRLGLLRMMEPGGGQTSLGKIYSLYAPSPDGAVDHSGRNGEAQTFAEKYMQEKIIRMMRDHRSHPSLIAYCIQNEINPDLNNPRIFNLIRLMQKHDPSRIILLKSGIPPINQVWVQPYDSTIYHDDGTGYSGWWDKHTVGGPGVWKDNFYTAPDSFTHYSANEKEIVMWGEMLGAAVPDNHSRMIAEIDSLGGQSYDLQDHRDLLDAYEAFLDKWRFRQAFPTAEKLFLDIGDKCYDFWGRVIETARLAEANDYLVISGWESTAIENHSGLVDNLRGYKGNPALLGDRLAPLRPVIKTKARVSEPGAANPIDLFVLNETGQTFTDSLEFRLVDPDGKVLYESVYPPPGWESDRFVYPIAESVLPPPIQKPGEYSLTFGFRGTDFIARETLRIIDPYAVVKLPKKVGVIAPGSELLNTLESFPGVAIEKYNPDNSYDLIVCSDKLLHGWTSVVDASTEIEGTDDDILFHTESWGYYRNLEYFFKDLDVDTARVTLRFAEVTLSGPGDRIMNVAINGEIVLDDFDICVAAGEKNTAFDTSFVVSLIDGSLKMTIPKLTVNYAKFSAIKITAGDSVIAINCGGPEYIDQNGLVWRPYQQKTFLTENVLARVDRGTPLLLLPDGEEAVDAYGKILGKAGCFNYHGHVGSVRASWMGSWYFVRDHVVMNGLPVNTAMKSDYQAPVSGSDGIVIDGKDVEVFIGYGRDHDRTIGAAGVVAKFGLGRIVFFSLPGMYDLSSESDSIQPIVARRLLANAMSYLGQ
ncbi:hypothetical protein JW992_05370, partial [candidate division KSB1 bacterium]|nr:hypothetical protein [candidate division KSB1 bacterium]